MLTKEEKKMKRKREYKKHLNTPRVELSTLQQKERNREREKKN